VYIYEYKCTISEQVCLCEHTHAHALSFKRIGFRRRFTHPYSHPCNIIANKYLEYVSIYSSAVYSRIPSICVYEKSMFMRRAYVFMRTHTHTRSLVHTPKWPSQTIGMHWHAKSFWCKMWVIKIFRMSWITATHCNALQHIFRIWVIPRICVHPLINSLCATTHSYVPWLTATHCNALQHILRIRVHLFIHNTLTEEIFVHV